MNLKPIRNTLLLAGLYHMHLTINEMNMFKLLL